MIGRGTRLHTDNDTGEVKKDFLIIDHWKNFAYFKLKPEGEVDRPSEPLPVRLFRLRLEKWLLIHAQQQETDASVAEMRSMLQGLSRHNINVRPHLDELDALILWWPTPNRGVVEHLSNIFAPLMRFSPVVGLEELQFRVWCERMMVALLKGDVGEQAKVRLLIQEAVAVLAESVSDVQRVAEQRAWVSSEGFWQHLDLLRLSSLENQFAPLMRYRTSAPSYTVEINLPDRVTQRSWIIYGPTGEGAFAESYREQVEALVRRLANQLPELTKLKSGSDLNVEELQRISDALNQADLFVTEDILRKVFEAPSASLSDFLRHILCDDAQLPNREERINAEFDVFIAAHGYLRANQLNFLRAVKAAVLRHGRISRTALSEPPLSRVGRVDTMFPSQDIEKLINLANRLLDEAA